MKNKTTIRLGKEKHKTTENQVLVWDVVKTGIRFVSTSQYSKVGMQELTKGLTKIEITI